MRLSLLIVVSSLVALSAHAAVAADVMTQDQCVAEFLAKPVKDWKGYEACARAATQLKVRGANGATTRSLMLPQTNAQPDASGQGTSTGGATVR